MHENLLPLIHAALDALQARCGVTSDRALALYLRSQGYRISQKTLSAWRRGKLAQNDVILVSAFAEVASKYERIGIDKAVAA